MGIKRILILIVIMVVCGAFGSVPKAEVLGSLVPRSKLEIGVQVRGFDREFVSRSEFSVLSGYDITLIGRYGLTDLATLSWELYAGDNELYDNSGFDIRYYILGIGLQTRIWEGYGFVIHPGIHYEEVLGFSTDGLSCHKRHRNITAVMLIERAWYVRKQKVIVWGGPGYFKYEIVWQRGTTSINCNGRLWSSYYNWGFTMGINIILLEHFEVYSSFIFVDRFQPRIGLMYRF